MNCFIGKQFAVFLDLHNIFILRNFHRNGMIVSVVYVDICQYLSDRWAEGYIADHLMQILAGKWKGAVIDHGERK